MYSTRNMTGVNLERISIGLCQRFIDKCKGKFTQSAKNRYYRTQRNTFMEIGVIITGEKEIESNLYDVFFLLNVT